MLSLFTNPILQTVAVGMAVNAVAGAGMLYLWTTDRRERFLMFWAVAWLSSVLRWGIHYPALENLGIRLLEALIASLVLSMVLLGAYDMMPRKRWPLSRLSWLLGLLFIAAVSAGAALDLLYQVFYAIVTLIAVFVVACFWNCYRYTRLSGYAFAAGAFAIQGVFYAVGLPLLGADIGNVVLAPILNIPTAASFLLIAYQRSQRELHNAEYTLRRIFDTAPIPMVITRAPRGEIEQFNQAALEMSGLTAGQLAGKTAVEAGIVIDAAGRRAVYDALHAGKTIVQQEISYLRGGTEKRIYAMNASAIRLEDGERYIFTLYDLSELRRAQQALETLNAGLERQVAERTRDLEGFGFTISHDLRAPLRHIDGFLAILQENLGENLDPENRKLMEIVQRAAKRMGDMIDDLLHFARLGNAPLQKRCCNLEQMVARSIAELETEAAGRDISWHVAVLPQVAADPSLLKQVLLNLLGNAIKYTGPVARAEIEFGVRPAARACDEQVFFVRDNGIGFNQAHAGKLFEVFQRLHNGADFEGTGIGLAIVERIIRKHGGRVWAEGIAGQGATFYFTLGPGATMTTDAVPATA